jgi:hypothetical protein
MGVNRGNGNGRPSGAPVPVDGPARCRAIGSGKEAAETAQPTGPPRDGGQSGAETVRSERAAAGRPPCRRRGSEDVAAHERVRMGEETQGVVPLSAV